MVVLGHDRAFGLLLTLILPLFCAGYSFAGSVTDSERADWYFRESLVSIRDWESVLERLDNGASAGIGSPGLPVPSSGDSVHWLNPISKSLLPAVDRDLRVQCRRVGEAIELTRTVGLEQDVSTVGIGDDIPVYQYPGGGGQDQWYHSYHRRFDRLTHVRPLLAPFGIQLKSPLQSGPLQWHKGGNEILATLTSYVDNVSVIHVKAELHLLTETEVLGSWPLTLDARDTKTLHIDVKLDGPGGGIVVVTCKTQNQTYWTPLFTSVEDVNAVIRSIELILADTPDSVGSEDLRELKLAVDAWPTIAPSHSGASWRRLFEDASRLRDRLLRARIDCDAILFVKRQPYFSEQPFMDAHHLFNRPGGGIYRLSPVGPEGSVTSIDESSESAELFLADVYAGLPSIVRGQARFLRIVEDVPRKDVDHGGVIVTADTLIFTVKRVLGTVPIELDGSAHFLVPADRNVYFEVLDSDHREIQRMRSVVCLKPGEQRGCIGCHEPRNLAPPAKQMTATWREPDRPVPPPWGDRILSYLRDVQPVFNAKCVACHTHDRLANRVILTDDLTEQFCIAYEELLPYLRTAVADRWDHPDDVYPRPTGTYGSRVSPLCEILADGHHGVELSDEEWQRVINWVDANAVYYDRYEHWYGPKRRIFSARMKETLGDVYGRRCAECHGQGDGRHDNWWLSLNRRNVESSRALAAPLSRSAGGWGRCEGTVFANTNDVDYRILRESLVELVEKLQVTPRADLRSIRGTSAERQAVEIPKPPSSRRVDVLEKDAVYLSDVPWTSARSGWTPNDDWLPRRDRDIRGEPLRLGPRICHKGIGTHAPSEIVVPVAEGYARLIADLYAAEHRGTVVFRVFGDGRLLIETPVMLGGNESRKIDVPVAGIRELRLVVTNGGDNHNCDMANWCNVRLAK